MEVPRYFAHWSSPLFIEKSEMLNWRIKIINLAHSPDVFWCVRLNNNPIQFIGFKKGANKWLPRATHLPYHGLMMNSSG